MNVLLVSHSFAPEQNGVARMATLLAESLVEQGCSVTVATQFSPNRKSNNWKGIKIEQFKITGNAATGIRGQVMSYQHFIHNSHFDIQHHHGCQIWGFDLLADWFPVRTRPVIVTPHGFSALNNSGWKLYFETFKITATNIDAFSCLSENSDEKRFLEGIRTEAIATSDGFGQLFHVRVIPNGVLLDEFQRSTLSKVLNLRKGEAYSKFQYNLRQKWKIGNRFWLLNVSNHVKTKGHRTLRSLAQSLPEMVVTNIGNPVSVERFGLGKTGLKSPCYYECLADNILIDNYLTKQTDRQTLIGAYQQADVFVMPSEIEAAPVVLLEAMAAGLPWVSFEVGNVAELSGGIVVQNEAQMREAILTLQHSPTLRQQLSAAGRAQAVERYDWKQVAKQYQQLYQSTIWGFEN
jgi:glycosyltransferase involved in cell wall biosynthesis